MRQLTDSQAGYIGWYEKVFGFIGPAATMLYDEQLI
jgi:hypothetical protein